jgi:hypothetical protein
MQPNTSSEMLTSPISFDRKRLFQPMQFPFFFLSTNEKVFRQQGANPGPFSPKESMLANQP